MRGTRYLETEISSAYANKRVFDLHQKKLHKIQNETRNPFINNTYLNRLSAGRRYASGKNSISPSNRNNQSILTDELSVKLMQMETPNKHQDTTHDTSRPDLTADTQTPHNINQTYGNHLNLKDKLSQEIQLNASVRQSFIPQLSDFKSNGRMSSIPRENLFYGQQPLNIYDYSLQQSSRYSATKKTHKGSTTTNGGSRNNKSLMSQVPFTQNQQIMSSFLRANEYRQIEKLSQLRQDNAKMLAKLEDISKGKIMSVGHHKVHPSTTRPKTLHMEKNKREAEQIDAQNNKILKAILHVKPSQASQLDKEHMKKQQKYFNNISKSQRTSIQILIKKRQQQIEQKKSMFPSILDYNKSINESIPFGVEGEYKDGYRVTEEEDSLDNYHPDEPKKSSRLKKAAGHNRSKSNLVVSHSYNIGSNTRNKLTKENIVNNYINQNSNQNTTRDSVGNTHQTSNEHTSDLDQLKKEFKQVKNNMSKQSGQSSPFKQEKQRNNANITKHFKSNPTAPQINQRSSDLNRSKIINNQSGGDKIKVNDSQDLKNHIFGEDVGSVERLIKVENAPVEPKSNFPKAVKQPEPLPPKAATPKKYSVPKVTPPLSSVYEDSFVQNSSQIDPKQSSTTNNIKFEQDTKNPKPSIDSSQPYSVDFGEQPTSFQKSQFASVQEDDGAVKNVIMTPSNVGAVTPNVQNQSAEVNLQDSVVENKFDAASAVTMNQPQVEQPQHKSQLPININKSMSNVPTKSQNVVTTEIHENLKGSDYSSNEIVSGQTVPLNHVKESSHQETGTIQNTYNQNHTHVSHEQYPVTSQEQHSTQQKEESQHVNRDSQYDLTQSNKVTTPIVPVDQVINQGSTPKGGQPQKIPLGDDASSKNSKSFVQATTSKVEPALEHSQGLENFQDAPNFAPENNTISAVEEGGSRSGAPKSPLSGRGHTTSPTAVMLKNQLNNNSAYGLNTPEQDQVAVKDDLDGGQPVLAVDEEIEDMSDNYEEDFD